MLEGVSRRKLGLPNGIEIALLDWGGSGPPLLLHHANGFCAAVWDLVARPLARDFRVLAMDARGHGDSSKPDPPEPYAWTWFAKDVGEVARTLARELGVPRLRAGVGNSFGGTAMLMASAGEAPFEELVLVDPVLPPPDLPAEGPTPRGNAMSEGALRRRAHWSTRAEAREWFGGKALFQTWEPRAIDLYVAEGLREVEDGVALQCPPAVEAAIFAQGFASGVQGAAARVDVPVCLARAGRGYMPQVAFDAMEAALPRGSQLVIDAPHLAPMEAPAAVVALVGEVLGAQAPSAPGSATG